MRIAIGYCEYQNINQNGGTRYGERLTEKLLSILMATQKPGEWVQSLINRFDAQVMSDVCFGPDSLRNKSVGMMNCIWDRPEYL